MTTPANEGHKMSRRSFLVAAAGSVMGAAMISMPSLSLAKSADMAKRTVRPVAFNAIPQDAIASAKASPLIQEAFKQVLDYAGTIENAGLRSSVQSLLKNPMPTFMPMLR